MESDSSSSSGYQPASPYYEESAVFGDAPGDAAGAVAGSTSLTPPAPTRYPGDFLSAREVLLNKTGPRTDRENPARAWLSLCEAFRKQDALLISRLIRLAKTSAWSHKSYDACDTYKSELVAPDEYLDEFEPYYGSSPDDAATERVLSDDEPLVHKTA